MNNNTGTVICTKYPKLQRCSCRNPSWKRYVPPTGSRQYHLAVHRITIIGLSYVPGNILHMYLNTDDNHKDKPSPAFASRRLNDRASETMDCGSGPGVRYTDINFQLPLLIQ
ncbi:hypothetical protein AVEN_169091-1 [Araneus ventricosus]|uniref:Uncharacterized protein n=1 Tax=Araneus ventricosus TaxID=182803 RepID=A0A4Y2ML57_ARAVE|nr:hypothetical protein AVEN_169091-1 [Araneus ventricosus]